MFKGQRGASQLKSYDSLLQDYKEWPRSLCRIFFSLFTQNLKYERVTFSLGSIYTLKTAGFALLKVMRLAGLEILAQHFISGVFLGEPPNPTTLTPGRLQP